MKHYKTTMTTRKANALMRRLSHLFADGTLGVADRFEYGEPIKGQKVVSFTPYVHPHKSDEANHSDLTAQASDVASVFPDYVPPALEEISSLQDGRASLTHAVMAEAVKVDVPPASASFLSNINV